MLGRHQVAINQPVLDHLRDVAHQRNEYARAHGLQHRAGVNENDTRRGVMSEYAYCVWAGIKFRDHEQHHGPPGQDDDINGVQIRSTTWATGHLLTYETDNPGPYVLVTLNKVHNDLVIATLRGWQWLDECNQLKWWRTNCRRPAYWTPQSELHPMSTLTVIYN